MSEKITYLKWNRKRKCKGGKFIRPRTKKIINTTEEEIKNRRKELEKRRQKKAKKKVKK